MRFPVDIATTQWRGETRQTVTFFQTPDGDLGALRDSERIVAGDFQEIMLVLLPDGPCDFRIPAELTVLPDSFGQTTGIVRLSISLARDDVTHGNAFTIHAEVEQDGRPLVAADRVSDSCLLSGIEKSLASIARLRKVIPQRCFFCRFSDYEAHTSLGNLKCYLGESAAYCEAAAKIGSNADARYQLFRLRGEPVDDLGTCAAFELRPRNWGYRG